MSVRGLLGDVRSGFLQAAGGSIWLVCLALVLASLAALVGIWRSEGALLVLFLVVMALLLALGAAFVVLFRHTRRMTKETRNHEAETSIGTAHREAELKWGPIIEEMRIIWTQRLRHLLDASDASSLPGAFRHFQESPQSDPDEQAAWNRYFRLWSLEAERLAASFAGMAKSPSADDPTYQGLRGAFRHLTEHLMELHKSFRMLVLEGSGKPRRRYSLTYHTFETALTDLDGRVWQLWDSLGALNARAVERTEQPAAAVPAGRVTLLKSEAGGQDQTPQAQAAQNAVRIQGARKLRRALEALWAPSDDFRKMRSFPDFYEKALFQIGEKTVAELNESGHASCAKEVKLAHEEIWLLLQRDLERQNREVSDAVQRLAAASDGFEKAPLDFAPVAEALWTAADTTGRYLAFAQFVFKTHPECAPDVKRHLEPWVADHAKLVDAMQDFEPEMENAGRPFKESAGLQRYGFHDFEGKPGSLKPSAGGR